MATGASAGVCQRSGYAKVTLLGHAALIANGLLVPLEAPDPPTLTITATFAWLRCNASVRAETADIAISWRRDGATIPGSAARTTSSLPTPATRWRVR